MEISWLAVGTARQLIDDCAWLDRAHLYAMTKNASVGIAQFSADGWDGSTYNSHPAAPWVASELSENFLGKPLGESESGIFNSIISLNQYDNAHYFSQGAALRVRTQPGDSPGTDPCTGTAFVGGYFTLSTPVPIGNTIWMRYKLFIPSEFSWGYTWDASDAAEADACGTPWNDFHDGNVDLKFMLMETSTGTSRCYVMPQVARRQLTLAGDQWTIISEASNSPQNFNKSLILNQWNDFVFAIKVSDTNGVGFMRFWLNDEFIGENTAANVGAAGTITKVGLIGYWNGKPYTDRDVGHGQYNERTDFWLDEFIVTTDILEGNAPTEVDAGGRVYIPSTVLAANVK